jgi:hypothetical protein
MRTNWSRSGGGYLARDDRVQRSLLRPIESTPDSIVKDGLGYLAWLVAEDRLEIRIAIPRDEGGVPTGGIYQEKFGIFPDDQGNAVVFTGSPNETTGGLVDDFDATDVFCSCKDQEGRGAKQEADG